MAIGRLTGVGRGLALALALGWALATGQAHSQAAPWPDPVDPPGSGTTGTTATHRVFLPMAQSNVPAWLGYVNGYRAMAGLAPLTNNAVWSEGGRLHAIYTVHNDALTHSEDPANPWYTPEGAAAAGASNVMASSNVNASDQSALDMWLSGPFHAVGILDPHLGQTGFGSFRASDGGFQMAAAFDTYRGRGDLPAGVRFPIIWPGNGAVVQLASYRGGEMPAPETGCGYSLPTGLPLIVQFGTGAGVPVVTASSFSQGSTALAHCTFTEATYTNPDAGQQSVGRTVLGMRDAVILMPRAPLTSGARYTASITANGVVATWTFTVR